MTAIGGMEIAPYKASWLNQLYTWAIFGIIMMAAWDSALMRSVAMLNDQSETAYRPGAARVLRRPYMITLALYTLISAWFSIAFMMLIVFCGCATLMLTAPLCKKTWESIVRKMFVTDVVFNSIDLMHAPFHGVAALGTFFAASIAIGFYVTDEDLIREPYAHGKVVRALFIPPAVVAICYGLYALFCTFSAATSDAKPAK